MPRPPNAEVRSRLLSRGTHIVRCQGFNASGVQEIAAAAGIPKGSFYNYFESKEAFAVEILDAYWTSMVDRYGPLLRQAAVTPMLRIELYFAGLAEFREQQAFAGGCLIGNLALEVTVSSDEVRMKVLAILREWTAALADCLHEARERGELSSGRDLDQLARALIGAYEGAVMRAKVERNATPFHRFGELVLPSLLR